MWHGIKNTDTERNDDAWSMAYACKNPVCSYTGVSYKSGEEELLSIERSSYGYDVLDHVDQLRFKQDMTAKELTDDTTCTRHPKQAPKIC
ncbi:hypothetical protein [Paenibacillus polymyxa]|jgi:hypothetical protein|uniref:hypothetical protein n=3 Tax=Paenibacillus TaxID=44249 RepID=UPI000674B4CF|nr:hypothetical protein [Paenibacillus polymyxa]KAF6626518.1 hypothetical protein HFE01_22215 [Paenibacillus sp. EKM10P]RFU00046.1 hypothetical protein DX902_00345 [Paenibacillus jamilae]